MTEYKASFSIETPNGALENVDCIFDIEYQVYPAEPYSWGQSRGKEIEVDASLAAIELGSHLLLPDECEKWLGSEAIAVLEAMAGEKWLADEDHRPEEQ